MIFLSWNILSQAEIKVLLAQRSQVDRHGNAKQLSHLWYSNSLPEFATEKGGSQHGIHYNRWMVMSTWDTKLWREAGRQDFVMLPSQPPPAGTKSGEKERLCRSEADTKAPSLPGCSIQSWLATPSLQEETCISWTYRGQGWYPPRKNHTRNFHL